VGVDQVPRFGTRHQDHALAASAVKER
jgi:hypothetical protein